MVNAPQPHDRLAAGVAHIETCLNELDAALASGDANRIEAQAQQLQRALSDGLSAAHTSAPQALTPDLRRRLQEAQARTQALQSAVQKALASTGRTLGTLFPQESKDTYGALGKAYR
jgi:Skp family chaperone for outer membrane proteins